MQFNFFRSKLFLLLSILLFYNNYAFSNNILKRKENICFNCKNFIFLKNKKKKECFSFFKKNKQYSQKYLLIFKNINYVGFFKNNVFSIFYIVKKNDTLYSIAKRLNCNLNTLLKYNNIKKPYKILVNQKILINNISIINNKEINYIIYSNNPIKHIIYTSFIENKINIIDILNKNFHLSEICFFYNKNNNKKKYINNQKNVFLTHWSWPLKNFNMNFVYNDSINNQGIEIFGIPEQSVFSSSKGKVVYVGDFFKNYGKLIIIKHNNDYLSIYGFNKHVFVKLNDEVYKHQKISTIGYLKNNLAKLYFEIRFRGNSINLLNLFPHIKLKKY